ncbi:MAG: STAS domain-containing protein [Sedimentisphaerales bacterium]|nr:STAS domain-containing protein [Sedimentisphaerales bacterium]
MAIHSISASTVLLTLPQEPDRSGELEATARMTTPKMSHHVIVDFSRVETMSSVTICGLIILNRLLSTTGRQLILCSVPPGIVAVFRRVGLHKLLQFAPDKSAAMQVLEQCACA